MIFFKEEIPGIITVDVGYKIAKGLSGLLNDKRLSFKVKSIIDDLFLESIVEHEIFGKTLAISNIGTLFEPDLKIDIVNLFSTHSANNALFVKWDGETDEKNIYFLSKENGIEIGLKDLSHIVI